MVGSTKQYQVAQLVLGLFFAGLLACLSSFSGKERLNKNENAAQTAQLSSLHPLAFSEEDVFYLTQALYFEDALGAVECQLLIAHVIQNRMYSERYPNTIKEVVWQNRQFSYTQDGKHERMLMKQTKTRLEHLARFVLGGHSVDNSGGSMFYYNPKLADPVWKNDYTPFVTCGQHIFLTTKSKGDWS